MKTLTKMGKMKLSQEWHERGGWLVLAGVATHSVERRAAYGMTVAETSKEDRLRRWMWTRVPKMPVLKRYLDVEPKDSGVSIVLLS